MGGDIRPLGLRDVGGIIQRGGTMLGSTRCEMLKIERGCDNALRTLRTHEIAALVVIGGNGSQTGAWELCRQGARVVGIASTIDNDLCGTDISIGATSAIDVALEAINQLRVTASSMTRAFLVELMGRHSGYLALMQALPEVPRRSSCRRRQRTLRASRRNYARPTCGERVTRSPWSLRVQNIMRKLCCNTFRNIRGDWDSICA